MILVTTPNIEGRRILEHRGVVGAEVIFGAFFLKDWLAEGTDILGGRSAVYEKTFEEARQKALAELAQRATGQGANGVVNIRFDYTVLGSGNTMLMVAATGTAVRLDFSEEDKRAQANAELESKAEVYLGEPRRGPFSKFQIRQLLVNGKVSLDTKLLDEDGQSLRTVGDYLGIEPS